MTRINYSCNWVGNELHLLVKTAGGMCGYLSPALLFYFHKIARGLSLLKAPAILKERKNK